MNKRNIKNKKIICIETNINVYVSENKSTRLSFFFYYTKKEYMHGYSNGSCNSDKNEREYFLQKKKKISDVNKYTTQ